MRNYNLENKKKSSKVIGMTIITIMMTFVLIGCQEAPKVNEIVKEDVVGTETEETSGSLGKDNKIERTEKEVEKELTELGVSKEMLKKAKEYGIEIEKINKRDLEKFPKTAPIEGELKKQIAEQGNISTLSSLRLNIDSTTDLTELYEAKNLTELDLYYHHDDENDAALIPDLSKLTKLKKVSINAPLITDMASVNLSNTVTDLVIRSNSVDNTEFLKNLNELNTFELHTAEIKHISNLENLINLDNISITGRYKGISKASEDKLYSKKYNDVVINAHSGIIDISKINASSMVIRDHEAESLEKYKNMPMYGKLTITGKNIVDLSNYLDIKSELSLSHLTNADYSTIGDKEFTKLKIEGEGSSKGLDKVKATQIYLFNPSQEMIDEVSKNETVEFLSTDHYAGGLDLSPLEGSSIKILVTDYASVIIDKLPAGIDITLLNTSEEQEKTIPARIKDRVTSYNR